jgi:gluconolactonase
MTPHAASLSALAVRRLERVVETDAHEGPVYVGDEDALYFTTVRRERVSIKRLAVAERTVSLVREDANMANGMTLDREDRLVICEQGTLATPARISRLDRATGAVETVVDAYDGLPFNSPNDVVVARDGGIWFTDPSYGWLQGFRPEPQLGDRVYRYDPALARLTVVADSLDKPNGLAFSPDERLLYVGDNGAPRHLLAFDVEDGVRLTGGRELAVSTPAHPDGIKVDADGRVYASFADGIQVFGPTGVLIGEVELPGAVNFTFGGRNRDVLYVTADTAIWAVTLGASGEGRSSKASGACLVQSGAMRRPRSRQ